MISKLSWGDLLRAAATPIQYVLEQRREAVYLFGLGLLSAVVGAAIPYAVGRFVDGLISLSQGSHAGDWMIPLLLWFVVVLISTIADWRLSVRANHLGNYIYTEFSHRAYSRLLLLPNVFHKKEKGGETLNKISRTAGHMSRLVSNILLTVGPQVASMLIGFAFAYSIEPRLAIVIMVGMVVYAFASFYTALPIAHLQQESNKAWNEAYGEAWDAIGSVYAVKQATGEVFQSRKIMESFANKAFLAALAPELLWDRITFFQRLAVMCTQLFVFVGSVYFVSEAEMTVGALVALTGYSAMVFGPLAQLASNWNMIQNGLTNIHDINIIMDMETEAYERPDGIPNKWGGEILFKNVSFSYPDALDKEVLQNVSFTVKDGQSVALVGESGVGKSTTVELVGGYYYPTQGEVWVSGQKTTSISLRPLREHIAVVPQEIVLFNGTVMENIRFGRPEASDSDVYEAAKKAYAHEFISNFADKYNQLVGDRGVKLSVGQKQRIAIARAILRNPSILILDEPTSALDAKTEAEITKSLESLMEGRTTIIIAHRLSTVRKADKIIVFENKQIAEMGTHAELIEKENGAYKRLYDYQIGLTA